MSVSTSQITSHHSYTVTQRYPVGSLCLDHQHFISGLQEVDLNKRSWEYLNLNYLKYWQSDSEAALLLTECMGFAKIKVSMAVRRKYYSLVGFDYTTKKTMKHSICCLVNFRTAFGTPALIWCSNTSQLWMCRKAASPFNIIVLSYGNGSQGRTEGSRSSNE